MQETKEIKGGGYYLFESLSSGRSSYFENNEETELFKRLWRRYMRGYIETHKIYLSSEGYHILLRIRDRKKLILKYVGICERRDKGVNIDYLKEPWRIVSEQVRIFHSTYVKRVNRLRGREGGLVKQRFRRFYFESVDEFRDYEEEMDEGKEIRGQRNARYRVSARWVKGVNWVGVRSLEWVESAMNQHFNNHVVSKIVKLTFKTHNPPP